MPQSFLLGFTFLIVLFAGAAIGQQCLEGPGLIIGLVLGAVIASLGGVAILHCRQRFFPDTSDADRRQPLAMAASEVAKLPLRMASVDDVASAISTAASDTGISLCDMQDDVVGGSLVVAGRNCAVCLEAFVAGDQQRTLPCFHIFHARCVDNWLSTSTFCPTCRHDVLINDVTENEQR